MLTYKNISVKYGSRMVLDGISFEVKPNSFTSLLGINGSGKSTLAAAALGMVKYSGEILLGGKDIKTIPLAERAKKIAVLPQTIQPADISVNALILSGRTPYARFGGKYSSEDILASEEALHLLSIENLADRSVSTLSGGERRKAYIAMTIAQKTPTVIFDEPTSALDAAFEGEIFSLFGKLAKSGRTLLVITHDLTRALRYSDNVIILDGTKIVFSGSSAECTNREIINEVFKVKKYTSGDNIFYSE